MAGSMKDDGTVVEMADRPQGELPDEMTDNVPDRALVWEYVGKFPKQVSLPTTSSPNTQTRA
jgi:hypothetical protein